MNYRGSTPPFEASRRDSHREGETFDDDHLLHRYNRTVYDYDLPDGTLLNQQCRYDFKEELLQSGVDAPEKKFLPRRPIDLVDRERNIGRFVFGPGERRVIYNWPKIIRAGPGATVFIAEGEKNAKALIAAGLLATTVISHKWTPECVAALTGFDCIILEDNDDNGRRIAAVAQKELSKVAKTTRIVSAAHLWKHLAEDRRRSGPGPTADVGNWLSLGGDPAKLIEICRELPTSGAVSAVPHQFPAEETIPMWDFLYGKHLLRGTTSVTAGSSKVGKSAKAIAENLAMTTGRSLLGINVARQLRVLLINLEDDRNTMDKRIQAAMKHYRLTPEDVGNRLFTVAKNEMKLKLASQTRSGVIEVDEAAKNGLIRFAKENAIDVISVDPLRKTHRLNENDNVAMGELIEIYDDISEAANCSTHLIHHVGKGNGTEMTVMSIRGASSIVDTTRSAEIVEKMTKATAEKFGIAEKDRWRFFHEHDARLNFAPQDDKSTWFKLESIELNNAGPLFGDDVGVVTRWQPPTASEVNLTSDHVARIKEAVGTEPRWRDYPTADMWVGKAIGPVMGLDPGSDKEAVKTVIKKLIGTGVLATQAGRDPNRREDKLFVVVAPASTGGAGQTGQM